LRVLYEPITSMSMTDLKAFVERPRIGARKLPAAPALFGVRIHRRFNILPSTYMTKSMLPSCFTHLSAAFCKSWASLTSTAPMPITFAPFRAVAISVAIFSVFSTLRPIIQAFAPRWTRARTWAEQMVPAPPVQKTTLLSIGECQLLLIDTAQVQEHIPNRPSLQTSLKYSYFSRGIVMSLRLNCVE
jgi:hypothetical protein